MLNLIFTSSKQIFHDNFNINMQILPPTDMNHLTYNHGRRCLCNYPTIVYIKNKDTGLLKMESRIIYECPLGTQVQR